MGSCIQIQVKNVFVISLCLLLGSCSKEQRDDCFTRAGDVKTETRTVASFTQIESNDRLQIILIQDSSKAGTIELTGPENLLPQIKTEVENGILRLFNTNTCNFVRSFEISFELKVFINKLDRIKTKGNTAITSQDTLWLDELSIFHNALSDVELTVVVEREVYINSFNSALTILHGRSKTLKGSIEEVSGVDARDLRCDEVLLDQHSPVDCYIDGTRLIYVKIYNTGNIYYMREPTLYKDLNYRRSSGDLILFQ